MSNFNPVSNPSDEEKEVRKEFLKQFKNCPIPDDVLLDNLSLFMSRRVLSRRLFFLEMYKEIINTNGVIMEFGVQWGRDLVHLETLRATYEPFNYNRKIIGFDTFEGLANLSEQKDSNQKIEEGAYSTTEGYEEYLKQILSLHEAESPLSHIKKYEVVKGDATETLKQYLDEHPETIIALAYFDMDIYKLGACPEKLHQ